MVIRIQRRRTKGWRMPEGARYVGRGTKYGNPWDLATVNRAGHLQPDGKPWTLDDIQRWYREWAESRLRADPTWLDDLLDAKALACWCKVSERCHADVLAEMVERRRDELRAAA